jgi:hypothetical protein
VGCSVALANSEPKGPVPGAAAVGLEQTLRAQTDGLARAADALRGAGAGRVDLQNTLRVIAAEREATLLALIEAAPALAVQNAIAAAQRDRLPASVQQHVERTTTETGTLEVLGWVAEDGRIGYQRYLVLGERRLRLTVDRISRDYKNGTILTVSGIVLGDRIAATNRDLVVREQPPIVTRGAVDQNGTSVHSALIINVNFSDLAEEPWTIDFAINRFAQIATWYEEGSYNQMTLASDIAGWFTIAASSGSCAAGAFRDQGEAAARAAGFEPNNYDHVVITFPRVQSCGFSGLAELGGRYVWLNNTIGYGVATHELGHNLGLFHSHSSRCSDGPLEGSCTTAEYGDRFDTMGNAGGGAHYHGSYRASVGWIPASDVRTLVPSDGEVVVALRSAESSFGTRVLRVQRRGLNDYLNIETREAVGFDSVLATFPAVLTGVEVYLGPTLSDQSIIDVAYTTETADDAPLQFGDTLYDHEGDVSITALYDREGERYVCVHYDLSTPGCVF